MKVMTIRNVPDSVYRAVSRLAERNRRSLQQQVLTLLERAQRLEGESPVRRASEIRERLSGRDLGDTVTEIRKERQR